jgi:hypothetical protein
LLEGLKSTFDSVFTVVEIGAIWFELHTLLLLLKSDDAVDCADIDAIAEMLFDSAIFPTSLTEYTLVTRFDCGAIMTHSASENVCAFTVSFV